MVGECPHEVFLPPLLSQQKEMALSSESLLLGFSGERDRERDRGGKVKGEVVSLHVVFLRFNNTVLG